MILKKKSQEQTDIVTVTSWRTNEQLNERIEEIAIGHHVIHQHVLIDVQHRGATGENEIEGHILQQSTARETLVDEKSVIDRLDQRLNRRPSNE